MLRALCFTAVIFAAPLGAAASDFPNKPGKKPQARLVLGAQSGASTTPSAGIVVGAGASGGASGGGDYGLGAPTPLRAAGPKTIVGYDPSTLPGNKEPNS